jgi:hypothetical protein
LPGSVVDRPLEARGGRLIKVEITGAPEAIERILASGAVRGLAAKHIRGILWIGGDVHSEDFGFCEWWVAATGCKLYRRP